MSATTNDFLASLALEVAEAKERKPAINLPIQVISYDNDTVIGTSLLSGEQVRVSLAEDKGAATRKNKRTSIEDRADTFSNRHVAPGALMVIERAYKQDDGTYKGFWTQAITHKPEEGFINNVNMNITYHEGDGKGKKPSIMTTFFTKNADHIHKVNSVEDLQNALQRTLAISVPAITPTAMIRISTNGEGMELHTISLKNKVTDVNGQKSYEFEPAKDAINRMMKERIGAVVTAIFNRADVGQATIEVIKGGTCFAPATQVGKVFNMATGKLIETAPNGNDTDAAVMNRMFSGTTTNPKTGEPQPVKLFADGIVCFSTAKPSQANPDGFLYQRYAKPIENSPKLVVAGNLESPNFKPNSTFIVETKESLDNTAPEDDELGISGADADAAREIDALMSNSPTGMKM